MNDDQGALNKAENALDDVVQGDLSAAGTEASGAMRDIGTSLKGLFTDDVIPALKLFIQQFASDFGSQALSQAAALAPAVLSGQTTIQSAAGTLAGQITADAVTDAEKDGTVALNALRVQITAQAPNATSSAPAAPASAS
jgi:hypothetical protein